MWRKTTRVSVVHVVSVPVEFFDLVQMLHLSFDQDLTCIHIRQEDLMETLLEKFEVLLMISC